MTTYTRKKRKRQINYRKIYEKYYGVKIGKDEFGRSHEIHHIDGNHANNDPLNLQEVTIQEHYNIHYAQGDWQACLIMSKRMSISVSEMEILRPKLKEAAKKRSIKQVNEGTHVFLGGEIQKRTQLRLVAEGKHYCQSEDYKQKIRERNTKLIAEGKHPWQDKERAREQALKLVADGINPWLSGELPKEIHKRKFADGSHHLLKITECPHCQKTGQMTIMKRWHFDNCKLKD